MNKITSGYTTIFTDIGGVLLTNGWDRNGRKKQSAILTWILLKRKKGIILHLIHMSLVKLH